MSFSAFYEAELDFSAQALPPCSTATSITQDPISLPIWRTSHLSDR